jgi:hypothetical protein
MPKAKQESFIGAEPSAGDPDRPTEEVHLEPGEIAVPEEGQETTDSPGVRPPETKAIVKAPVLIGNRGIQINDLESLWRFSQAVSRSGLAPKGLEHPEAILVAIQMGLEIGLSPMSALQNIAVINGRPGIFGDAALALVRASGLLEWIKETYEGEGDSRMALCVSQRKGSPEPLPTPFSVADAKRAGLWGKAGPWTQYPDRMLRFRARGFNLRDNFGDVLKGFRTIEELADIESEVVSSEPVEIPGNGKSKTERVRERLEKQAETTTA